MDAGSVIRTKLFPPPDRPALVRRPRLLEALTAQGLRRLTVVSAPAGFGKTTLLGQWFRDLTNRGCCCWLSVDENEQAPRRFLQYLVASLQTGADGIGAHLVRRMETVDVSDITDALPDLINDIDAAGIRMALFIDDFHRASSPGVLQFIDLLVHLAPAQFHLVLATRIRPRLPLAELKVRNQLAEITAADLRFDENEAAEFLAGVHGLRLTGTQLANLVDHSEGWVAGLQLASLSLHDPARADTFIDTFSGNLRDIADYLATDVLDNQPEPIRDFLLRTSILQRLNADASAALTGVENAAQLLENLEERNLFIVPMDQERNWYRYHALFQEFLQGQLRRRLPGAVVSLYGKAAAWFSAAGFAREAVDYALLSGDTALAVKLVKSQVWNEMAAGRMPLANDWVDRIPEELRLGDPELLVAKCSALYHMNRADDAESVLLTLRERVAGRRCPPVISEQIRILQAAVSMSRDDVDNVLSHLEAPFEHLAAFESGIVHNVRGYALAELNEIDRARESILAARRFHEECGAAFGVVYADCFLGMIDLARGNLQSCHERFEREPKADAGYAETYVAPVSRVMRGNVLYEWGRSDEALELLRPGLPILEQVGHIRLLALGYLTLARISAVRGDCAGAGRHLDHCLSLGARRGMPYAHLQVLLNAERIRICIDAGRINEALDLAPSIGVDVDERAPRVPAQWDRFQFPRLLAWARLQIASGSPGQAVPVLRQLAALAIRMNRAPAAIDALLVEARAGRDNGDGRMAAMRIEEALLLAAPNRRLQVFIEAGEPLRPLILAAARELFMSREDVARRFMVTVDEALRAHLPERIQAAAQSAGPVPYPGISQREIEILELLAAGQSNHLIASRLQISDNTVKWHIKNIYSKMGVNNRTAAVVTAQRLGLL